MRAAFRRTAATRSTAGPDAPAGADDLAVAQPDAARVARAQPRIDRLGLLDLRPLGPGAGRDVAPGRAALDDRGHVGAHPVVVAALGAVLHQPLPGAAGLDGRPE